MRQLTVNVPDNKIAFFIDLANNLGFTVENSPAKNVLTEEQMKLVEEARTQLKENPHVFLKWEDARKTLNTED